MNDVISWLATNNTWMIRFGFTAVIVLIGVYIFRSFFVANSKIKTDVAPESENKEVKETEAIKEQKLSAAVSEVAAELEKKHQAEVENFKRQISELAIVREENQKLVAQLGEQKQELEQFKLQQQSANMNNSKSTAEAIEPKEVSADTSGLHKKIEELQARLAEYEIIAEDISEIGQLRQDNEELRRRIADLAGAEPAAVQVSASAESVAQEMTKENVTQATPVEPEYSNSSDQLLDEMLAEHESNKSTQQDSSYADIPDVPNIKSDKPVTATEQQMLNQFEESLVKKVSS